MKKLVLKLFVCGKSRQTEENIAALKKLCNDHFKDRHELSIIEVTEHPEIAEKEKILVTPTLLKECPPPLKKIIGDLSDEKNVTITLEQLEGNTGGTPV